jgi:hypothetical protein
LTRYCHKLIKHYDILAQSSTHLLKKGVLFSLGGTKLASFWPLETIYGHYHNSCHKTICLGDGYMQHRSWCSSDAITTPSCFHDQITCSETNTLSLLWEGVISHSHGSWEKPIHLWSSLTTRTYCS